MNTPSIRANLCKKSNIHFLIRGLIIAGFFLINGSHGINSTNVAFADIVQLKSGQVINAPIISRNQEMIKMDIDSASITFYPEEIEAINGQPFSPLDPEPSRQAVDHEDNGAGSPHSFTDPIASLSQSVVIINILRREKPPLLATGFFVSEDGLIATNFHPIIEAESISIETKKGDRYPVDHIANYNEDLDIAILKIAANKLPSIKIGDSNMLKPEERVRSIGHPGGNYYQVIDGTYLERKTIHSQEILIFKIIAQQGGSGSPIFNANDEVIAISTLSTTSQEGFSYGIPINIAKQYFNYGKLMTLDELKSSIHPAFIETYYAQGAQWEGRNEDALHYFQKALNDDPQYIKAAIGLAQSYESLGQEQNAAQAWMEVLKQDPDNENAHRFLGNMYLEREMYPEAIAHLEEAIRLAPQTVHVYNNLGIAYGKLGELDKAIQIYLKTVEIDPKYGNGYFNLAVAYYDKRDMETAKKYCHIALNLGYDVPDTLLDSLNLSK